MNLRLYKLILAIIIIVFANALLSAQNSDSSGTLLLTKFRQAFSSVYRDGLLPKNAKVDSLYFTGGQDTVVLRFTRELELLPLRPAFVKSLYTKCSEALTAADLTKPVRIMCGPEVVERLIPEVYKPADKRDSGKLLPVAAEPFILPLDKSRVYANGLSGHNLIVWQSHGWYYSHGTKRWEWQRPRLFETVEDLVPMSYVLPFLVPMLENSGAYVFMPRERDIQTEEIVVDNDKPAAAVYKETPKGKTKNGWKTGEGKGFLAPIKPLEEKQNPFAEGTYRVIASDKKGTASAEWKANIKKPGKYSVSVGYVSLPNSIKDAVYTVKYSDGEASFKINQQVGGGTWIYLGTFYFAPGEPASVTLSNKSALTGVVTADVVRFGGGMGNVSRGGAVSGRARYLEGARYWMQYAGMPDTLVYDMNKGENDYKDDYQCRAEYGNFISGAPGGPNRERTNKGLGIPLSLSLAFHTDAGITQTDTVIGSLAIYSSAGAKGEKEFPSGGSRLINRDLSDLVQTQLVNDIRILFDKDWTRRQLRDADYSEATRPNIPALLLEAFSHQNYADMRLHHDPLFRFTLARAIYKGIVKFLKGDTLAAVQPLPVSALSIETKNETFVLNWKPVQDKTEQNAAPRKYRVYTRKGDKGFDGGVITEQPQFVYKGIKKGEVYSFYVTAVNDAGESFPSEIVSSVYNGSKAKHALVVNGFTRVSGPEGFNIPGFKGFFRILDEGVAWGKQFNITGMQYDFDPQSPYRSNDESGNGASGAETETDITAGNTFDNIVIHSRALAAAGYSVSSVSEEALGGLTTGIYDVIDVVYGEQKATKRINQRDTTVHYVLFTAPVRNVLESYLSSGGRLIISGSYIASDAVTGAAPDTLTRQFLKKVLKYQFNSRHASVTGKVIQPEGKNPVLPAVTYRVKGTEDFYGAEASGSLLPAGSARVLLRYAENLTPAAVGFSGKGGVVAFGFPLETINDGKKLNEVISGTLNFLFEKSGK